MVSCQDGFSLPRLGAGLFKSSPTYSSGLLPQLGSIINSTNLTSIANSIFWSLSRSNMFTVMSCYEILNDEGLRSPFTTIIWKCVSPLNVKIFTWLAIKDKILTQGNLLKKGWQGSSHCDICGFNEESTMHIFLNCTISWLIWNFLLRNANSILSNITLC